MTSQLEPSDPRHREEQDIKQRIEYDRWMRSIDATGGVALAWPDLRQFFPDGGRDWTRHVDHVAFTSTSGVVGGTYGYRKGEAQIRIDVYVSSRGPQPALQKLIDTMMATSIGSRRYERGPADIGQICLVLPGKNPSLVLVIDRNVFLRIDRVEHEMDLVAVARGLAKLMDANVVPVLAARVPTFGVVSVNPPTPEVDEQVKVTFQLPAAFPADQLMSTVALDADPNIIDRRGRGADNVEVRIRRPGRIDVPLWLADRRTLLSSEIRVGIDVRP